MQTCLLFFPSFSIHFRSPEHHTHSPEPCVTQDLQPAREPQIPEQSSPVTRLDPGHTAGSAAREWQLPSDGQNPHSGRTFLMSTLYLNAVVNSLLESFDTTK